MTSPDAEQQKLKTLQISSDNLAMRKNQNPLVCDSVSSRKSTDQQLQPQDGFAFLPDDILMCILTRLDVRDVARCRFVCKKWKDLISNPRFLDSLLMQVSNLPMILAKYTIDSQPYARQSANICIDKWWGTDNTLIHHTVGINPFTAEFDDQSSQNGFIFTRNRNRPPFEFIVCNPMTREQVTIFLHKQSLPECLQSVNIFGIFRRDDQYCTLWRVWVLVNSVYHTQYKILNLGSSCAQPTTTCCWRNIGHLWSHWWVPDTSVVCLEGFMYWMVNHHPNGDISFAPLIIAFDMKTQDFTEISLPTTYTHSQHKYPSNLVNVDGSLSLVKVVVDDVITVKMWTLLKDASKTRSWSASDYVLRQVQCPPMLWKVEQHFHRRSPRAVAFVNPELVIQGDVRDDGSKGLFVCNLEFGTLRDLGENNKYSRDAMFWAYHPSIASLRNCQPMINVSATHE